MYVMIARETAPLTVFCHRSARLAIAEPTVFSSLILVEAGIVAYPGSGPLVDKRTVPYLVYAIKRESWWPSR